MRVRIREGARLIVDFIRADAEAIASVQTVWIIAVFPTLVCLIVWRASPAIAVAAGLAWGVSGTAQNAWAGFEIAVRQRYTKLSTIARVVFGLWLVPGALLGLGAGAGPDGMIVGALAVGTGQAVATVRATKKIRSRTWHPSLHDPAASVEDDLGWFVERRAQEPDSYLLANNHGFVLLHAGRVEEASAELERAVALDPERAGVLANLALAKVLGGHDEAAWSLLDRVRTAAKADLGSELEGALYEFAFRPERRGEAATEMERHLANGLRCSGVALQPVLDEAMARNHPDIDLLRSYGERIRDGDPRASKSSAA